MRHCPINEEKHNRTLLTFALALLGMIFILSPVCVESAVAKDKPEVTNVQKAIINALVQDDYEVLSTGLNIQGTKLGEEIAHEYKGLIAASVSELEAAYRKNESAADQKYLRKWILVSGTLGSAEWNTGILQLKGVESPSRTVKATLKKTKTSSSYLSKLKDGQTVQLICQGGLKDQSPTLHNCEFLAEVALPLQDDFRAQLLEAMRGKGNLEENAIWVFTILKIEQLLGEKGEQACLQSTSECLKEIILHRNAELPKGIPQAYLDLGYTKDMLPDE